MQRSLVIGVALAFVGCPAPKPKPRPAPRPGVKRRTPPPRPVAPRRRAAPPKRYRAYFKATRAGKPSGSAFLGYVKTGAGARFTLRERRTVSWGEVAHTVTVLTDAGSNVMRVIATRVEREANTTLRIFSRHLLRSGPEGAILTITKLGYQWDKRLGTTPLLPLLRFPLLAGYVLARGMSFDSDAPRKIRAIDPIRGAKGTVTVTAKRSGDTATITIDLGSRGQFALKYDTATAKVLGVSGTGRIPSYQPGGKPPAVPRPPASLSRASKVKPFKWPKGLVAQGVNVTTRDKTVLTGTLTLPKGVRKPRVVIIVPRATARDQDGTRGLRRPYGELAAFLTRKNYATYRYALRGSRLKASARSKVTLRALSRDLGAVVNTIRKRRDVNRKRIYLMGHAEGGLVVLAYTAARRGRGIRGIALFSVPGVPYADYITDQYRRRWESAGLPRKQVENRIQWFKAQLGRVAAGQRKAFLNRAGPLVAELMKLDVQKAYRKIKTPTLILAGQADITVRVADVNALRAAMPKNRRITISRPIKVGRMLQRSPRRLEVTEEWNLPSPIAGSVRATILAWLKKHR